MVTATTLPLPRVIHGQTTPVASKKDPAQTEPKAEFTATPVDKKMTSEKLTQQDQRTAQLEKHRATNFDGTDVLVIRQKDGVENTTPLPPEHSKKLQQSLASAPKLSHQEAPYVTLPFDTKA